MQLCRSERGLSPVINKKTYKALTPWSEGFFYCTVFQSVESDTVNIVVVGSSPTGTAKSYILLKRYVIRGDEIGSRA